MSGSTLPSDSLSGISEGLRGGAVLGVVAIALGVSGLSPSLTWIPEVPLLAAFVIVPAAIVGLTGYSAGSSAGRVMAGAIAGGIAGAIGGCLGGLTYVAFGKPVVNVLIGTLAGVVGGGILGAIGARFALSRKEA